MRNPNTRDVDCFSLLNMEIQVQNFALNFTGWDSDISPMTLIMLSSVLRTLK